MLEVSSKTHSNTPKLSTRLAIALCTYFVVRVCHHSLECCNTWRTSLQASKAKSKSCSSACTPVNLPTSTNSWCSTMWTSLKCQMTRMLCWDRLLSPTHNTLHPKRTDPTWWVKLVMCEKMRFTLKATSDRTSWMQSDWCTLQESLFLAGESSALSSQAILAQSSYLNERKTKSSLLQEPNQLSHQGIPLADLRARDPLTTNRRGSRKSKTPWQVPSVFNRVSLQARMPEMTIPSRTTQVLLLPSRLGPPILKFDRLPSVS